MAMPCLEKLGKENIRRIRRRSQGQAKPGKRFPCRLEHRCSGRGHVSGRCRAARLRAAAVRLGVTPSAVSQAIRNLDVWTRFCPQPSADDALSASELPTTGSSDPTAAAPPSPALCHVSGRKGGQFSADDQFVRTGASSRQRNAQHLPGCRPRQYLLVSRRFVQEALDFLDGSDRGSGSARRLATSRFERRQ
jgi:hypothetical protein